MSQTDNCWEAIAQQIEKMLWRMAILQLILYVTIKGAEVRGYMELIGGKLGRLEKGKRKIRLDKEQN